MKKRLLFFFTAACMLMASSLRAQYYYNERYGYFFQQKFGFHAGTQGLGMDLSLPLHQQVALNIGGSILPFNMPMNSVLGSYQIRSNARAELYNIHLMLDWAPFPESGAVLGKFVMSGGLAYFFKASGRVDSHLKDNYFYGDIEVPKEDVGMLRTEINWKNKLAPYAGIGMQNLYTSERWSLGFSLGTYYMTAPPEVKLTGTNLLAGNEVNEETVTRNMSTYRWWPVLQISLSHDF